jgi:hypothetical protein
MGCSNSKQVDANVPPTPPPPQAGDAINFEEEEDSAVPNPLHLVPGVAPPPTCPAFHRDPALEDTTTPTPTTGGPADATGTRRHRGATDVGVRHGYRTDEPSPQDRADHLKRLTDIAREVHGYTEDANQYPAPPPDAACVRRSLRVCAEWLRGQACYAQTAV